MDGTQSSVELFERRAAAVAGELRTMIAAELPDIGRADGWAITGAGGSEGPARILMALLAGSVRARFVPLSAFAAGSPARPGEGLVVMSQGLCPNARLALATQPSFARAVLVTSLAADAAAPETDPRHAVHRFVDAGGVHLRHGPGLEPELLVRTVGPAVAALTAMRLADRIAPGAHDLGALAAIPAAVERAADAGRRAADALPAALPEGIALVTAGALQDLAHGLRWKLLETLGMGDPPVWDVLQLAHGPFQQFYERTLLCCTLESPSAHDRALFDRLQGMLVPGRHAVVRLAATLAPPLGWFEHDAQLNQLVLAILRRRPRNLRDWPGKGKDALLYGLGT
jgi:hypothetical protein